MATKGVGWGFRTKNVELLQEYYKKKVGFPTKNDSLLRFFFGFPNVILVVSPF